MSIATASKTRYYPQMAQEIHPQIKEEVRYVRDALYDLRDGALWDVKQFTLTASINFGPGNLTFTKGRPVLLIFAQDGNGGHTVTFDAAIKGISTVTIDTRANTYSTLMLFPLSDSVVYVMGGVTGGNL
jgi:hypothetical protein